MGSPTAIGPREGVFAPGTVVGKYTITREVGRGGMCLVYEARHVDLDKIVALKTLKADVAGEPQVRQRFLREGRAASRIHHPHVVDVVDVGEHEGAVYMVMEFLRGEDLADHIKAVGALPVAVAVELLLPVVSAISVAHEHGVVHRDLKPANIFLARGRHGQLVPKVVDFGISKLAGDDPNAAGLTGTDALLGTPYYMAPEQVRGARHTVPATDQYALGVILYQSLTGRRPFEGTNVYNTLERIMGGQYPSLRSVRGDIPEALEAVVARAMAHDANARFGSVAELGAALLAFASAPVQALWAQEFGGVRVSAPPPSTTLPSIPPSLAPSGAKEPLSQTQPLGAAEPVPPTIETWRTTTTELPARQEPGPPKRTAVMLALLFAAAVVVGSAGAFLGARSGQGEREAQLATSTGAPSPQAPAATALPAAPPVAAPPVAAPTPAVAAPAVAAPAAEGAAPTQPAPGAAPAPAAEGIAQGEPQTGATGALPAERDAGAPERAPAAAPRGVATRTEAPRPLRPRLPRRDSTFFVRPEATPIHTGAR